MKEFSNLITLTPTESSQQAVTLFADTFDFKPEAVNDGPGIVWNCDHVFIIDRPDDDVLRFFGIPRSVILTLKDTSGATYPVGTDTVPAQAYITAHLYRCQLVVTCKMTTNPLI